MVDTIVAMTLKCGHRIRHQDVCHHIGRVTDGMTASMAVMKMTVNRVMILSTLTLVKKVVVYTVETILQTGQTIHHQDVCHHIGYVTGGKTASMAVTKMTVNKVMILSTLILVKKVEVHTVEMILQTGQTIHYQDVWHHIGCVTGGMTASMV
jgi:hypothetical protein